MAFQQPVAWAEHTGIIAMCPHCGRVIPFEAILNGRACSSGEVFSPNPKGATVPCHSEKSP